MSYRIACDFKGCKRALAKGTAVEEGWFQIILPEQLFSHDYLDFCPDHNPPNEVGTMEPLFKWARENT